MKRYEKYTMSADETARIAAHMVAERVLVPALRELYATPTYKEGTNSRIYEEIECAVDASRRMVDCEMFCDAVKNAASDFDDVFEVFLRFESFLYGMHEAYREEQSDVESGAMAVADKIARGHAQR